TNVTAIHSTTEILAEAAEIPPDQQSRFLGILRQEGGRLAEVAQGLAAYFDRAGSDPAGAATPEEELDHFLEAHDHHFPSLDEAPGDASRLAPLLEHPLLTSSQARILAQTHLARYAADAEALPLQPFHKAARALAFDPLRLAARFGAPPFRAFRRLATLRRPGLDAPPMACLQVNAAGHVEMRRPLPGIPLPRHGTACPLWPIFEALSRPDQPLARLCRLPDDSEILALALAQPAEQPAFGQPPRYRAATLLVPVIQARAAGLLPRGQNESPHPVGPGCRICPRPDCAARAEASVLG
ncbi:MAG TPA: short-chain fatty acyl-CoA regulator family protein, partial [Paracoccaceae bacterium]|nr:short-chain fatty acyl-CoA regulator family protein [Paracoccaceae bacterium]